MFRAKGSLISCLAAVLIIVLLGLTTLGCGAPQTGPAEKKEGAKAPQEKVLRIGASVPLTGNLSKEGNLTRQGYELWRDFVNERGGIKVGNDTYKIELILYDDKSDANTSGKLTEKLITEDKVNFMLSPYSSGLTQATSSICEKYKMVNIAPSANAYGIYTRGYKYIFGIFPPGPTAACVVENMAVEDKLDVKTVGILTPDDIYPLSAAEGARDNAKELGLEVVMFEKYPKGCNDFSAVVSKMKTVNPDILILTGYFEEIVMIIRQMKELKAYAKIIGNKGAPAIPDFVKTLGKDAEGIYSQVEWTPDAGWTGPVFGSAQDYTKLFKQKFGSEPSYHAATATAGGLVLQLAIEKAGTLDMEAVRKALTEIYVETFFMPIKFGKWKEMEQINVAGCNLAQQIQNGKPVTVYPRKVRTAPPIFPMPKWQ